MSVDYAGPKKASFGLPFKIKSLLSRLGIKGILILMVVLTTLGGFGYLYWLYTDTKATASDPQAAATAALQGTLNKVGKLMVLPEDETPTLATVTDVDKLKTQAFFAKAKNGDKVLIYTENRLAILYDPVGNKIVAVGTVNLGTTGQ